MRARGFRTTSGAFKPNRPTRVPNTGTATFVKPAHWDDAVLLLERAD